MPESLSNKTWDILVARIKERRMHTVLGSVPALVVCLGAEIARRWAADYACPFPNPESLIEVAQYLAIKFDPLFPKEQILQQFAGVKGPDFNDLDEPHAPFFDTDFSPTPANPVVYHLHGHTLPESLVLTEDDYLSFLANIARNSKLLPVPIQKALDRSTCLFYRLSTGGLELMNNLCQSSLQDSDWKVLLARINKVSARRFSGARWPSTLTARAWCPPEARFWSGT